MLHRTLLIHGGSLRIPGAEEVENQVLLNRLKHRRRLPFSLRAITATRLQGWLAGAGVIFSAAFFLGPWMWDEMQELLGNKFVPLEPSQMPITSPQWWENEWRKMNPTWRAGESMPDFFVKPYRFVKTQTGRDLSSAADFRRTAPPSTASDNRSSFSIGGWRYRIARLFQSSPGRSAETLSGDPPLALIPLCGDSPIIRTMALQGFEVDAVDASQTAMQSAVERTELGLPPSLYTHVHLHWTNFFSPELWEGPLKARQYDVIYERQGMTSLNREQRPDYAYLLKQALKPDGVLYVEGIFRTGRVRGNKVSGPPYSLSRKELEYLFPSSEGYFVRCEEKTDAMMQLSRENRILKRVPRELYVTPFDCVVFKERGVNIATRSEPLQCPDPPVLTPTL